MARDEAPGVMFQSLDWVDVDFDSAMPTIVILTRDSSFNPSTGLMLISTGSIPVRRPAPSTSFNPSTGLMLISTTHRIATNSLWLKFQSLDWVDVDFDQVADVLIGRAQRVSIPRLG